MAKYAIKNLKADVEDQAPNFELSPNLEARFARGDLEADNFAVSYLRGRHRTSGSRSATTTGSRKSSTSS